MHHHLTAGNKLETFQRAPQFMRIGGVGLGCFRFPEFLEQSQTQLQGLFTPVLTAIVLHNPGNAGIQLLPADADFVLL